MARDGTVKAVAALTTAAAVAGLALQLVLFVGLFGAAQGVWRYIGFFTTWSNVAVAVIAGAVWAGGGSRLAGPRVCLAGLTAITVVGLVYAVLLRSLWDPQGWHKLAGILLHDVSPLLFVLLWVVMPHGRLQWRDIGWALAAPALYLACALARGQIDGWYPYYFLDPAGHAGGGLIAWLAGVMATFAIVAGGAVAIDRRLGGRDGPTAPLATP